MLSGLGVDQSKVLAAFRHHSSKKSNAYMLEGSQAEKDAKERGDWEIKFVAAAEKMRAEKSDNPMVINELVQNLLDSGLKRLKSKSE